MVGPCINVRRSSPLAAAPGRSMCLKQVLNRSVRDSGRLVRRAQGRSCVTVEILGIRWLGGFFFFALLSPWGMGPFQVIFFIASWYSSSPICSRYGSCNG